MPDEQAVEGDGRILFKVTFILFSWRKTLRKASFQLLGNVADIQSEYFQSKASAVVTPLLA